jgi:hypothetical protein
MAKKARKTSKPAAKKSGAKKPAAKKPAAKGTSKLKLQKKRLADLPARKGGAGVKGGSTLSLGGLTPQAPSTFAPPYVPVGPVVTSVRPSTLLRPPQ